MSWFNITKQYKQLMQRREALVKLKTFAPLADELNSAFSRVNNAYSMHMTYQKQHIKSGLGGESRLLRLFMPLILRIKCARAIDHANHLLDMHETYHKREAKIAAQKKKMAEITGEKPPIINNIYRWPNLKRTRKSDDETLKTPPASPDRSPPPSPIIIKPKKSRIINENIADSILTLARPVL